MKNKAINKNTGIKKSTAKRLAIITLGIVGLLIVGLAIILKPIWVEAYCQNEANKIVGDQWDRMYPAESWETQYVTQITWGYREQLRCEKKF